MKLWLVRHAQPLVEPGVCYGAADIPADAQATARQAHQLVGLLPAHVRIFSSPLQRCESLASALCSLRPDLVYQRDTRLREMNFGRWERVRWRDIPRIEFDAWMADFAHYRAGGGESVAALMKRAGSALKTTRELARTSARAANTEAVWITHAGVIRAATLVAQGIVHLSSARQWPSAGPAYGHWQELRNI